MAAPGSSHTWTALTCALCSARAPQLLGKRCAATSQGCSARSCGSSTSSDAPFIPARMEKKKNRPAGSILGRRRAVQALVSSKAQSAQEADGRRSTSMAGKHTSPGAVDVLVLSPTALQSSKLPRPAIQSPDHEAIQQVTRGSSVAAVTNSPWRSLLGRLTAARRSVPTAAGSSSPPPSERGEREIGGDAQQLAVIYGFERGRFQWWPQVADRALWTSRSRCVGLRPAAPS